jgi:hypothetical protein
MKHFKDLLSEVAQPKSPEERAFKDQHKIELIKHPVAPDFVHTGEIPGKTKKERPADQKDDVSNYDQAYDKAQKKKAFKMPRNIDESEEETGIERFSDRDVKMAIGIASDKRYAGGNMTGAVTAINKLAKGLSRHPQVAAVLKRQNESNAISFKSLMSKVSHSEDLLESPQEEISMMMKQLNFICYASEEIQEYLEIDGLDPEEWWQSKLAQVFSQVKSLYAYAKGNEITNKAIDLDKDDDDIEGDDDAVDVDLEAGYINSGMYEEVEVTGQITEKFDLSESKIDVDYIGSDGQKASHEKRFNVKISMHGNGQAFVSGEPKDVWKFAVSHYGDADDAADVHKGLAKSVGVKTESLEKKSSLIEANFKPGNIRLKNGQSVKLDFKDVKALNAMMKGLNPKNRKEMETSMMKDKKGFGEILKFATQAGV